MLVNHELQRQTSRPPSASMKMAVFRDVAPYNLEETDRRFSGDYWRKLTTSVNLYEPTRRNMPRDGYFQTRHRENLISR